MKVRKLHKWTVDYQEAVKIQRRLAEQLSFEKLSANPSLVAGADVSYSKRKGRFYAAVVLLRLPGMEEMESRQARGMVKFPYVPGFLSFREAPVLLRAFAKLHTCPDVVIIDGQGTAHPRGLGLASHMGLLLDVPTVGCAKSRLVGEEKPVGEKRGSHSSLVYKSRIIGARLRTRERVKPVYVSPGHQIDLQGAIKVVMQSCSAYRLPEPIRWAHHRVTLMRKDDES